jgi:hypothetical protein
MNKKEIEEYEGMILKMARKTSDVAMEEYWTEYCLDDMRFTKDQKGTFHAGLDLGVYLGLTLMCKTSPVDQKVKEVVFNGF